MNKNTIEKAIIALAAKSAPVRDILEYMAARRYSHMFTTVDRFAANVKLGRLEIIETLKKFDELQLGKFIMGRGTNPTRFVWNFELVSIGRTGLQMESSTLIPLDPAFKDQENAVDAGHLMAIGHDLKDQAVNIHLRIEANLPKGKAKRLADFIQEFSSVS